MIDQTTPSYYSPLQFRHDQKYSDSARTELVTLIGGNVRDILEVGCHTGATGALIKNARPGVRYYGIEIDPAAAAKARNRLDGVVVTDIEHAHLEQLGFQRGSFDLIMFADVLEHLYDPWQVLATMREYLRPDGAVLASIPNIQNLGMIEQLARGYWTYAESGLLDGTHVRFFTLTEIIRLFAWTGYRIEQCVATCIPAFPTDVQWPRDLEFGSVVLKNVSRDQAQGLFAFQYLVLARKNGKALPERQS